MVGVIEDLPNTERFERIRAIAAALVELLRSNGGAMAVLDVLRETAARFNTMISQIRYGLDYALSLKLVRLSDEKTLALA